MIIVREKERPVKSPFQISSIIPNFIFEAR